MVHMAFLILAMASGYCILGAFLGMRITRIPIPAPRSIDPSHAESNEAAEFEPTEAVPESASDQSAQEELRFVSAATEEQVEPKYAAGTYEDPAELNATHGDSERAPVPE